MASNKTACSPFRNGDSTTGKGLFNGVTSTPLSSPRTRLSNSLFSPSRITPMRTPPRYLLSETSNRLDPNLKSSPLLKSSKYNSNLAAYTDGKSPGLPGRIVQYSNEAATHQAKYGSPGLFPVVHFFKKDKPVIVPKPERVMVRLASPDLHWYNNKYSKHNLKDSVEIRNGLHSTQHVPETETRSVLDALREISRKRIHTDSEYDTTPDSSCKRQKRADTDTGTYESNKRSREDSPKSDTSNPGASTSHQSKKICVVDVLAASFTSSRLLKEKMQNVKKRGAEVEVESPIEQSEPKRQATTNAETQTINQEPNKNVPVSTTKQKSTDVEKIPEKIPDVEEVNNKEKQEEAAQTFSTIFDEKKLEVQRKNKLAMLLGAIAGEKPNLLSYGNSVDEKVEKENKLVGILSPVNKVKHDKHVHFNLTPEVKSFDKNSELIEKKTVEVTKESIVETPKSDKNITQTSSATLSTITTTTSTLSTPIVTTMVTKASGDSNTPSNVNPISKLSFTFGNCPTSNNNIETPKKAPTTTTTTQSSGGFKFNLSEANSSTSSLKTVDLIPKPTESSSSPPFNFGGIPKSSTVNTNMNNSVTSSSNTINFGHSKPQTSVVEANTSKSNPALFTFSTGSNSVKDSTTTISSPLFGGFGTASSTTTAVTNQTLTTQPTLKFGGGTSTFGTPTMVTSQANVSLNPTVGFGITTVSNSMFGTVMSSTAFGGNNTNNNLNSSTTATSGFATSSSFGNNAPGFSKTTSNADTTVIATTTSAPIPTPAFGITTSNVGFGANTSTPAFGTTSASIFGSNASGFGIGTTSSSFVVPNTTATNAPAFPTPPAAFGAPSTSVVASTKSSKPVFNFGGNNNFTPSGFGGNTFGVPSTSTTGFGTSTTTTGFGGFGTPSMTTAGFGTTTTNSMGFGGNKFNNSGFGVPATTAPSTGGFGNNTFGSGGAFGTTSQSNNSFGNSFGAKTQTTTSSVFGNTAFGVTTTANTGFTTNTGFGNQTIRNFFNKSTTSGFTATTTAPPAFATNNSTPNKPFNFGGAAPNNTGFNTPSTFNFGSPNQTGFNENKPTGFGTSSFISPNGFGSNTSTTTATTTSMFGSTNGFGNTSGFSTSFGGSNNNPTPAFGNTFGTSNTNAFGNNNTFATNTPNFGFGNGDVSSNFAKTQVPTGFGAGSGDSTFQFGGGNNNAAAPVFGATNPANNTAPGAGQVFSFGTANPATPSSTGVFTFGTPEQKSNFPGNNNAPGFATPNTFGANVGGNFGTTQFGTPTAGMFSIGSGSSTGQKRYQLKAKRRN